MNLPVDEGAKCTTQRKECLSHYRSEYKFDTHNHKCHLISANRGLLMPLMLNCGMCEDTN